MRRDGADKSCGQLWVCPHLPTKLQVNQAIKIAFGYHVSYLPVTKSVSLPNRPNQWRWTTVSFRLALCYSPCSPSNWKHFKFHLSAYNSIARYIYSTRRSTCLGVCTTCAKSTSSLSPLPPPMPNPCIMIPLLQSKQQTVTPKTCRSWCMKTVL